MRIVIGSFTWVQGVIALSFVALLAVASLLLFLASRRKPGWKGLAALGSFLFGTGLTSLLFTFYSGGFRFGPIVAVPTFILTITAWGVAFLFIFLTVVDCINGRSLAGLFSSVVTVFLMMCLAVGWVMAIQHDRRERPLSRLSPIHEVGGVTLNFNNTEYIHRWTSHNLYEFTPPGQEDLSKWNDMLTIRYFKQIRNGDELAMLSNEVLASYKNNQAVILKADSFPQTPEQHAKHLISAVFYEPNYIELTIVKLQLFQGMGVAVFYAHRIYGYNIGNKMRDWIDKNAASMERALLKWDSIPK